MSSNYSRNLRAIASVAAAWSWMGPALADCTSLLAEFKTAIARQSIGDARRLEQAIRADRICQGEASKARDERLDLQLALASTGRSPYDVPGAREAAIVEATELSQSWRAQYALGNLRAAQRRFGEANAAYKIAIQLVGRPVGASAAEKRDLIKAEETVMLIANDDEGKSAQPFISTRDADGKPGGIYSENVSLRADMGVEKRLVPIKFETNSDQFSRNGKMAVEEFHEALSQQGVTKVTVIGHADKRGTDALNMALSERRARRVAKELRDRGLDAEIRIEWKGKSQPYDVSGLAFKPTEEEELALNRRVEVIW